MKYKRIAPFFGLFAGLIGLTAIIPQIIKCLETKSTHDLSLWSVGISLTSISFWLIYGLFKKDPSLIFANAINFILSTLLILIKLRYG